MVTVPLFASIPTELAFLVSIFPAVSFITTAFDLSVVLFNIYIPTEFTWSTVIVSSFFNVVIPVAVLAISAYIPTLFWGVPDTVFRFIVPLFVIV